MPEALRRTLPDRPRLRRGLVQRLQDRRGQQRIVRDFTRATVPPAAEQWGRFGRSFIVPPARVNSPHCVFIGDGVEVLEHVWMSVFQTFDDITPRLVLDDRVRVGRGCQFSVVGEVIVEPDVLIGDFVQIGDTSHPYEAHIRGPATTRPRAVRIGARAMLGSHVVVLPGVTIGAGAIVDHHAVVNADVAPGVVVRGNPAVPVTV